MYVFVRGQDRVSWTHQAKLVPFGGGTNHHFGVKVVFDGKTALISSHLEGTENGGWSGAAYIFVKSPSNEWIGQARLLPQDGAPNDVFGLGLALNGDVALIGAYGKTLQLVSGSIFSGDTISTIGEAGAAYIFIRNQDGLWEEQAKILPPAPKIGSVWERRGVRRGCSLDW